MSATYKVRIAPVVKGTFSTATAYAKNDIVRYDTASYIFTADKAAGAWDSSKVQMVCQDGTNGTNGTSGTNGTNGTDAVFTIMTTEPTAAQVTEGQVVFVVES